MKIIVGIVLLGTLNAALALEPSKLRVSRGEARESLIGLMRDWKARGGTLTPELRSGVARAIRAYRSEGVMPIATAPFPDTLVLAAIPEAYSKLYDISWNTEYAKIVENTPLELLYDGLLEMIANNDLPEAMKEVGSQVGECWAKKALKAREDKDCKLDTSETISEPGKIKLGWYKLACGIASACGSRKILFEAAKPDLIKARKDPATKESIKKAFSSKFPKEFRAGFIAQISEYRRQFPKILAEKLSAPIEGKEWMLPLIELDEGAQKQAKLSSVVRGVLADLDSALLLSQSADAGERALGGVLFYGVANRLLVITGGLQATWDGNAYAIADEMDKNKPRQAPMFRAVSFGGFGASAAGVSAWDVAKYKPEAGFRVFPSAFNLGSNALPSVVGPPEQSLGDLADLLTVSSNFLKATAPGAPFSKYFGSSDLEQLFDPKTAVIFPKEGRMLAVGLIAAAAQNLVAAGVGHIEVVAPGPGAGFGLIFHDRAALDGRSATPASTQEVAKVLVAAAELRETLSADPDVPQELKDMVPKLNDLLQAGSMTLQGQQGGMGDDGGYFDRLTERAGARAFRTSVMALRAITRAYDVSEIGILRMSAKLTWDYLDRFFAHGHVPVAVEGAPNQPISPAEIALFLELWAETQVKIGPAIRAGSDWSKWDNRVASLRARLDGQLSSESGLEPLSN